MSAEPTPHAVSLPGAHGGTIYVQHEDLDLVEQHRWYLTRDGYAVRRAPAPMPRGAALYLGRIILARILGRPLEPGERVAYIDGDQQNLIRANIGVRRFHVREVNGHAQ